MARVASGDVVGDAEAGGIVREGSLPLLKERGGRRAA